MERVELSRGVPERYVGVGPATDEEEYGAANEYTEDHIQLGVGVVLMGPAKIARSECMARVHGYAMFHNEQWGQKDAIWSNARDIAYCFAIDIVDEVFGESCLSILSTCKWLTVDGLGTETDFKNHVPRMNDLLRRRVDNQVCTSFTTSLGPNKIITTYGVDFWEKMKEGCLILSAKEQS